MGHVTVDRVVERRHIRGALNRGMATQRHNARAWPAEISQQKLQQRGATDDLRAVRMLGPGHGVCKCRRAVAARVGEDRFGHFEKRLFWAPGCPLDHLRRVTAEMFFNNLENATWVL